MRNNFLLQHRVNFWMLTIPDGVCVKEPIRIPSPAKLTVKVAKGVSATLVIEHLKSAKSAISIEAGSESKLRIVFIQNLPKTVNFSDAVEVQVAKSAQVHFFGIHLGGKNIQSAVTQTAHGQNAHLDMDLITRAAGDQKFEFKLRNHFEARESQGVITAKGVAEGKGSIKIQGIIKIEKTASQTDARLSSAMLNLGPKTMIQVIPMLSIETNDVQVSHSAGITNLNEEELFYLESRGLSKAKAKKMLVHGFLKESLQKLNDLPQLQAQINQYL